VSSVVSVGDVNGVAFSTITNSYTVQPTTTNGNNSSLNDKNTTNIVTKAIKFER